MFVHDSFFIIQHFWHFLYRFIHLTSNMMIYSGLNQTYMERNHKNCLPCQCFVTKQSYTRTLDKSLLCHQKNITYVLLC